MSSGQIYWVNYNEALLDDGIYQLDIHPDFKNNMLPLGKVNIFVGANNSGKSRALRALFAREDSNIAIQDEMISYVEMVKKDFQEFSDSRNRFSEISKLLEENILNSLDRVLAKYIKPKPQRLRVNFETFSEHTVMDSELKVIDDTISMLSTLKAGEKLDFKWRGSVDQLLEILGRLDSLMKINERSKFLSIEEVEQVNSYKSASLRLKEKFIGAVFLQAVAGRIYIPTLRSLNSLMNIENRRIDDDFYEQTTIINYFSRNKAALAHEKYKIQTGQKLFWEILEARNGKREQRAALVEFEKFIAECFFPGQTFDITANVSINQLRNKVDGNTHHVIASIDGTDRAIHDLGDGIQSIIMLTFPIFNAPDNSWIFIEEPETHLHPGLQRIFMQVLLENEVIKKKNLRFFLTTHSNHLLDLMLTERQDISIFTFRDDPSTKKKVVKNVLSGDQDLLSQLGVQSSSVFIANCSIWVEGITDRLYMRAYLQAYQDAHPELARVREDLDFAFFEYAGTNLSHYLFADPAEIKEDLPGIKSMRLSNRILVLADQDEGKDKKHEGLKAAEHSNFTYEFYPGVREVENLLSPKVLIEVLPKIFPKVKGRVIDLSVLKYAKYKMLYMGKYLQKTLGNDLFVKSDVAKTGTIGSAKKLTLAEAASKIIAWDNMTPEAQKLSKLIYNFIRQPDKPQ